MKNLKLFGLMLLLGATTFTSCTTDDKGERVYGGETLLNFNKGTENNVFVFSGTGFTDVSIEYGTLKAVTGTNDVSLVVDTETSTAVEGTDFVITSSSDVLENGETTGMFTVRFLEDPAVQTGKVANFKLVSTTLNSTVTNSVYSVNVSLACPISSFVGDFSATSWWLGTSSHSIVEDSTTPNTLLINDFWEDNGVAPNFKVTYNDAFVVTFLAQDTGYFVAQYNGNIFARMSTVATNVSTLNPCSRTMSVWVNYYIPNVGSYGDKQEVFTGI